MSFRMQSFVVAVALIGLGLTGPVLAWQEPAATQEPATAQEPAADEKPAFDSALLVGEWAIVSGKRQGADVGADRLPPSVVFDAEKLTMPVGEGPDEAFVMSYKLDTSVDPVAVDFDIVSGPAPAGHAVGILKWDGTALTLCYDPMGTDRPDAFSTSEKDGRFLFVLKKKATPFDKAAMLGTWTYESGMIAGEALAKERLAGEIVVTETEISIPAGPDAKYVMSYQVTGETSPASLDMSLVSGPVSEGKAIGLVGLEGDTMTICYALDGDKRPEQLDSTGDNGHYLFVMKRKVQ